MGAAGFLFACGDDISVISSDGDGGIDGSSDIDRSAPDSSEPSPDASPDAQDDSDASTDASTDDGGEVYPDAGLTMENYAGSLAHVLCRALARCCFGNADLEHGDPVDGGAAFDRDTCVAFYTNVGFESSSGELPTSDDNLTLNNAKGDECVAKIENLTCDTPGIMYTTVASACFSAVVGKLGAGEPCTKSVECLPGHFCTAAGSEPGTCAVLRTEGQDCGDWINTGTTDYKAERSGEACSYRGKGVDTGLYCDFFDFVEGKYRPQDEWKCKQAGGVNAQCLSTPWCKDSLCDDLDTLTCQSPKLFFAPSGPGATYGCGKFAKL